MATVERPGLTASTVAKVFNCWQGLRYLFEQELLDLQEVFSLYAANPLSIQASSFPI